MTVVHVVLRSSLLSACGTAFTGNFEDIFVWPTSGQKFAKEIYATQIFEKSVLKHLPTCRKSLGILSLQIFGLFTLRQICDTRMNVLQLSCNSLEIQNELIPSCVVSLNKTH